MDNIQKQIRSTTFSANTKLIYFLKNSFRDENEKAKRVRPPQQAFVSFTLRKEQTVDNIRG
jgi:hypothetical protein